MILARSHVFQSTHPRRVRPEVVDGQQPVMSFNPRTHVGCDLWPFDKLLIIWSFNPRTHVGCDSQSFGRSLCSRCFNPRTHVGCDTTYGAQSMNKFKFQSTHPRRVRRYRPASMATIISFNPRTHVGCDPAARRMDYRNGRFNPRTHVGCDDGVYYSNLRWLCFNPRTHVGCDACTARRTGGLS